MKYRIKKYCPNFKRLRIVFKDKIRHNWVGDWNIRKNQIMIHKKLKDIDKLGIIVHKFIEMVASTTMGIPDCCSNRYKQGVHGKKNELAHSIANRIERKILELGGYSWKAHQRRWRILKNEKSKKKI